MITIGSRVSIWFSDEGCTQKEVLAVKPYRGKLSYNCMLVLKTGESSTTEVPYFDPERGSDDESDTS